MLVLTVALVAAQTSSEAFAARAAELWPQTPFVRGLRASIEAAREQTAATLTDAPLGGSASIGLTHFQRTRSADVASAGRPLLALDTRGEVHFRSRSGVDATLAGAVPWSVADPRYAPVPNQLPFALEASVAYDVVRGGRSGLVWTRFDAQARSIEASMHQLRQQLLEDRLRLVRQVTRLSVVTCKLKALGAARDEVQRAVEEGKLRLQTRVLSYKDFLNFQDLENNFRRQLATQQTDQAIAVAQLRVFGPEVTALGEEMAEKGVECVPSFAEAARRALAVVGPAELEGIPRSLPAVRAGEASLAAAELRERAAALSRYPSVAPYVDAQLGRVVPQADALFSAGAGLRGTFDLVLPRARHEIDAARLEQRAAQQTVEVQTLSNQTALNALRVEIAAVIRNEEIQQLSLKTTRELLKTLEAQRAIGQVDTLTFASAWLNATQTQLQLLDSWGSVARAGQELSTYVEWATQPPVP